MNVTIGIKIKSIAILWLSAACISPASRTQRDNPSTSLESSPPSWSIFKTKIISRPDYSVFLNAGPYPYSVYYNYRISLKPSLTIDSDYYKAKSGPGSPLAIIMHGNGYSKLTHRLQGEHLASWGIHTLLINLPNHGQWIKNGKILKRVTQMVHSWPELLSRNIDLSRIILVGHSFGGSASVIAASGNSPVAGVILLDPAMVHPSVRTYLQKIHRPILILGADKSVFRSKKRPQFFHNSGGAVTEFSLTGATHTDAQLPGIQSVRWGFEWEADETIQRRFLAFITGGLFSLAGTGSLNYAWAMFRNAETSGAVKNGKNKGVISFKSPLSRSSHRP